MVIDDVLQPLPSDLTEEERIVVLGARSVPEARWTNYGALAFLIGKPAIAVARVLESAEVKVGRDMTEQRDRPPSEWLVPWHRIRMADGSVKARGGDVTREHRVHQLWVDEGGVEARPLVASESVFFQPAANSDNQRLAAARQSDPGLAERVAARRAERIADRGY